MKKVSKQTLIFCTLLAIVGFSLYQLQTKVLAEQSGSSPESAVTSRIKTIYDLSLIHIYPATFSSSAPGTLNKSSPFTQPPVPYGIPTGLNE